MNNQKPKPILIGNPDYFNKPKKVSIDQLILKANIDQLKDQINAVKNDDRVKLNELIAGCNGLYRQLPGKLREEVGEILLEVACYEVALKVMDNMKDRDRILSNHFDKLTKFL